ncbi:MAG: helix-turn-helix domain-containing protein [Syntrophorhabdales bacterium]
MKGIEKRLLTVNQACEYLSISRMSLYRLIRSKIIAPVVIAGRTLIDREDLEQLIQQAKGQERGMTAKRGRKPSKEGN